MPGEMDTPTSNMRSRWAAFLVASTMIVSGAGYADQKTSALSSDQLKSEVDRLLAPSGLVGRANPVMKPTPSSSKRRAAPVSAPASSKKSSKEEMGSNEEMVRRWLNLPQGQPAVTPMAPSSSSSSSFSASPLSLDPLSPVPQVQVRSSTEYPKEHLEYRDARYRFSVLGRSVSGRDSEDSVGIGLMLQGPDWYRDVDPYSHADPKLARGWRLSVSQHDFDTPVAGSTTPLQEEFILLTAGVGWDYFFKRQWKPVRDAKGHLQYDNYGRLHKTRTNTPYLSAWLEAMVFADVKGTSRAFQKDSGEFNNDTGALTLGGGYQFGSRVRIGVEHSIASGDFQATTLSLGSSF